MANDLVNGNAVSGPIRLVPVSNKLQDKMRTLREVIDRNKSSALRINEEMKQLIEDRTQLIIWELESIWDQVNTRMNKKREELNKKIEEINKRKNELENLFKNLNPTSIPKIEINDSINSVRREMDIEIPYIKLTWRVDELMESIQRLCTCEQLNVKYRENTNIRLKWATCSKGKGDNELWNPYGVAIDSINNRIFVANDGTHRIQVFSVNGDWIKSLNNEQMKKPENINFIHNSLLVQCPKNIVKFNRTSLTIDSHKSYDYSLSGICTDNASIYVGAYNEMKLISITRELKEESFIFLITQYKHEDSRILDIAVARGEFYVLITDSEYPIQSFSKQGTLNRCIVHRELLTDVFCFCLDQQLNILITDTGSNQVKLFSNVGKLITKFGKRGTAKGAFSDLRGIAVDDSCGIITTDHKCHHRLQTFYPE